MKRWNLLAASLIAATFVLLALSPMTRNALRFDVRMAAGAPGMSGILVDLGFRQSDLPLNGFGPPISAVRDTAAANSPEFSVRLANAMQLPGKTKWATLQQLVADFPDNPAGHAALVRIACKNGGSVGVGHSVDQAELFTRSEQAATSNGGEGDPNDAAIMLRSCEAGERLDPENAYFPAMAAVAHLAVNQDEAARAALHRAVEKPYWREYIEVEAQGKIRRAEILYGPQNSLTETVGMASILFPHYAALRGMGRVMTVQAMHTEQKGDLKAGLDLRMDIARLGNKMRELSSNLIAGLVGIAMEYCAQQRPGGAPLVKIEGEEGKEARQRTTQQFLAYLETHGSTADITRWQKYMAAAEESRVITGSAGDVTVFGPLTLFLTQWQLLTNQALVGVTVFLCMLGGLALLRPWLGQQSGRVGTVLVVSFFIAAVLWATWQGIGNFRNLIAFSNMINGLSTDSSANMDLARVQEEVFRRAIYLELSLGLATLLVPVIYLSTVGALAKRRGISMGWFLRRWTLPLAALLVVGYAVHLNSFALREQGIQAELQEVLTHEGRLTAKKLGRIWPVVRD